MHHKQYQKLEDECDFDTKGYTCVLYCITELQYKIVKNH